MTNNTMGKPSIQGPVFIDGKGVERDNIFKFLSMQISEYVPGQADWSKH